MARHYNSFQCYGNFLDFSFFEAFGLLLSPKTGMSTPCLPTPYNDDRAAYAQSIQDRPRSVRSDNLYVTAALSSLPFFSDSPNELGTLLRSNTDCGGNTYCSECCAVDFFPAQDRKFLMASHFKTNNIRIADNFKITTCWFFTFIKTPKKWPDLRHFFV